MTDNPERPILGGPQYPLNDLNYQRFAILGAATGVAFRAKLLDQFAPVDPCISWSDMQVKTSPRGHVSRTLRKEDYFFLLQSLSRQGQDQESFIIFARVSCDTME